MLEITDPEFKAYIKDIIDLKIKNKEIILGFGSVTHYHAIHVNYFNNTTLSNIDRDKFYVKIYFKERTRRHSSVSSDSIQTVTFNDSLKRGFKLSKV